MAPANKVKRECHIFGLQHFLKSFLPIIALLTFTGNFLHYHSFILVNPPVDTFYVLRAEVIPGCTAYDTITIRINRSLPVNLGKDVSFCTGDSIIIKSGYGFNTYLWSKGAASLLLLVNAAGIYS